MDETIEDLQQALLVVMPDLMSGAWTRWKLTLGALQQTRSVNDEGFPHMVQALETVSCELDPDLWSLAQADLAFLYQRRSGGTRDENEHMALHHFTLALRNGDLTPQYCPPRYRQSLWAGVHEGLADSLAFLPVLDADTYERIFVHYNNVLTTVTRESDPAAWAHIHSKIGCAYLHPPPPTRHEKRAEYLELSIKHLELSLVPALQQKNPHQWMLSHLGLASSYQRRQAGNRDENDERCIKHAREGLAVDTMVTDLDAWTDLHVILAYRYPERKGGDRNENLNAAVEHAETALRVRQRSTGDGTAWADLQRLLGSTLVALGKYKRALAPLKLALEVFTLDRSPESFAGAHQLLATCYQHLDDSSLVIEHAHQALALWAPNCRPLT